MKRILIVLFACVASLVLPLRGQDESMTAKDITEKLRQRSEMIDDLTASFDQRVKFGYSSIEQNFSGTLVFRKPNKYRITSEAQTIVTDGTTVWAYSPANKQVIIDKYKESGNSISPEQFLLSLPTAYYVSLLGTDKEKAYILKLVPKDDRSFVRSVKLTVDSKTWNVRSMLITDVNDTETTYTIRDMKLNTRVHDREFTFSPPEGTDVVDLR